MELRQSVRGRRANKEMENSRKDKRRGGFAAPRLNNGKKKNREKGESEAARKPAKESPQMKGRDLQVGRAPGGRHREQPTPRHRSVLSGHGGRGRAFCVEDRSGLSLGSEAKSHSGNQGKTFFPIQTGDALQPSILQPVW